MLLAGWPAEFNVHIVEDAAQAVGATWNGKRAGSLGLAAAFSFYPTKNLSAFGDAGAVTTNDAKLAERMRSLRNHGGKQRYYHDEVGANSRLDSIQAAVLRVKMSHLAKWNEARRERARTYGRLLSSAGLTKTGADSTAPVVLLKTLPGAHHIYHQYVIRVRDRDKLRAFLSERGIGSRFTIPFRCICRNVLLILAMLRAICRKPNAQLWTCWLCLSSLSSRKTSSGM